MGKYFQLQCKRLLRFLPGILLVTVILAGSLWFAYQLFTQQNANQEENQKFAIGLCGETDDPFLQMGLSALSSFDSSRYAIDVQLMEEQEAVRTLNKGEIAAYAVIPEGFMDAAFAGQILPIEFYTTPGATGIVSLVKEELCETITSMLVSSQKGVFGMWDTMVDNGLRSKTDGQMDRMSLIYVDYIFTRDRIYSLNELGIADALGLEGHVLCGLCVLLSTLICLPLAQQMIPGDRALGQLLSAKGKPAWKQAICDFGAYGVTLLCVLMVLTVGLVFVPQIDNGLALFGRLIPVVLLAVCLSFMFYSLSRDLISGVMLQFFASVILCFVSGCLYPVYFFPVLVQRIAQWLPTSLARIYLAGYITGSTPAYTLPVLLGYCAVFVAVGLWSRVRHVQEVRL